MTHRPEADLEQALRQLPFVSAGTDLLTELRAQHVLTLLHQTNPNLVGSMRRQIDAVESEVRADVAVNERGEILLSTSQLRGAIARAAIRGCTQASFDEAASLLDVSTLEEMFRNDGAAETEGAMRTAGYPQPTLFDHEAA